MPKTILPIDWQQVNHVVFDFGGVLYRIDPRRSAEAFRTLGFERFEDHYSLTLQSGLINDLECGRITEAEFLGTLQSRCHPGTDVEDVRAAWNATLLGLRENVMPILRDVSSRFDMLMFSNTNAIHAEHFEHQILNEQGRSFHRAFRQVIYSHRLGQRKPHLRAYHRVVQEFNLNPETTLFIDDNVLNAIGAQKAGWQAVHHLPEERSLAELMRALGFYD